MTARQLTNMRERVEAALDATTLTRLGLETQFARRLRDVTPHRMAVCLVTGLAVERVMTLADLLRVFNALTGRRVRYKPFHNQLVKEQFPAFMRGVFEHLASRLVMRVLGAGPGHALRQFEDIVVHDGSSMQLADSLRAQFPGRFSNSCPAAVELHATMSVLRDQPLRVSLAADCVAEREFLPEPASLTGKLLLADRGYASIGYCTQLAEAGASFIIRGKKDIVPVVLQDPRRRTVPQLLRRGRGADWNVEWLRAGQRVQLRLVVLWSRPRRQHVFLLTNLPRERFDAHAVDQLYRLRWQVELLFKEWKSHANLHRFATSKATIAEGLVWASLSAALLKRFLAHAAQLVLRAEVSTRTTAMAVGHHLALLARALLGARPVARPLSQLLRFLVHNASRAHPRRDRLTGRLRSGLRPTWLAADFSLRTAKD